MINDRLLESCEEELALLAPLILNSQINILLIKAKMQTQPNNWPKDAPNYHSPEGWEVEKRMAMESLRQQFKPVGINEDEAKVLIKTFRRELELLQNKYYFSQLHTADIKHMPVCQGVFDLLYKAEKAAFALEAKLS
jgi:hypothetical protein